MKNMRKLGIVGLDGHGPVAIGIRKDGRMGIDKGIRSRKWPNGCTWPRG